MSPQNIQELLAELSAEPDREAVASEIEVLQSIYGDDAIQLWKPESPPGRDKDPNTARYEATLCLPSPHDAISFKVVVSIPPSYPSTSPPQLQLLSRYIGAFGADSGLFGLVLRTYISAKGVEWVPDNVCVFDGLQNVVEVCNEWYQTKLTEEQIGELRREDALEKEHQHSNDHHADKAHAQPDIKPVELPAGIHIFEADPIVDRKSSFVGRACAISDPAQVPLILAYLNSDRRIARAAHPIINAWRCQVGPLLHQDNDDDGETAAGGRLAHLLQILEISNVLVVVTRYFGGIHLGPDRFKHINQAARNALEVGGFLDEPQSKKAKGRK